MFQSFRTIPFQLACLAGLFSLGAPQLPAQTIPSPNSSGVAVLSDGRVFKGTISEVAGGYRVQSEQGSVILPFQQVSLTSISMIGAYEAYRDSFKQPNANNHLTLAEWCMANGLWPQAKLEVEEALRLEPLRSDAQSLQQQIDNYLMATVTAPSARPALAASSPASAVPAAPARQEERLKNGMTKSTYRLYVSRVQPILNNRCSDSACHGSIAANKLTIIHVRHNASNLKQATEENLAALEPYLDLKEPASSRLLTTLNRPGPDHRNLFLGNQVQQYETILQWVYELAADSRTPALKSSITPVAGTQSPGSAVRQAGGTSPRGRDAFNPNSFNQMMHGGGSPGTGGGMGRMGMGGPGMMPGR
jgi:hypothetical protein